MTDTMKAFVMQGIDEVALVDKPIPRDPGPNGAIVKTTRALVCTSDTHTVGARLLGAGLVIAVETVPRRKELAKHFGADEVVDFAEVDPIEAIMRLTDGSGVDSSIEALGSDETFQLCIKATRPGGTISNIGYHGEGDFVRIPRLAWGVGMNDQTIRTALCPGGRERMQRLMRLLQTKRVDPTPMTTHTFDFGDIEKAFRMMQNKEDGIIKPLIAFG